LTAGSPRPRKISTTRGKRLSQGSGRRRNDLLKAARARPSA
jgi:hypothetical protein